MTTNGISILLLARSLEIGGAERQLVELAKGLHRCGCNVTVAVFYKKGALLAELEGAGVRVIDLRKKAGGISSFSSLAPATRSPKLGPMCSTASSAAQTWSLPRSGHWSRA